MADQLALDDWPSRLITAGVIDEDAQVLVPATVLALINDLHEHNEELLEVKQTLQNRNTNLEVQNKRLRKQQDAKLRENERYPEAMEVLEFWREHLHPGAVDLGGERLKKVIARLTPSPESAGYTVERLKECVLGYKRFPYVANHRRLAHGTPGQRRVDAELVFRDGTYVERGLTMYAEAQHRAQPLVEEPEGSAAPLSALGATAVQLAERGVYVFPVGIMGKKPVTQNGLLDATLDVAKIRQFWLAHPEHNLAIRCGIESQMVVLDVDDRHGGLESLRQLERTYQPLPTTTTVVTPGGGTHFYFLHPGEGQIRNTASFPANGLDIRGDGGYVLCPPSIGADGKPYEWDDFSPRAKMPDWLLGLLLDHQSKRTALQKDWAAELRRDYKEGERDNTLTSWVGKFWSYGLPPEEVMELTLMINTTKCKPPLPDRDIERMVESISRREGRKVLAGLTS